MVILDIFFNQFQYIEQGFQKYSQYEGRLRQSISSKAFFLTKHFVLFFMLIFYPQITSKYLILLTNISLFLTTALDCGQLSQCHISPPAVFTLWTLWGVYRIREKEYYNLAMCCLNVCVQSVNTPNQLNIYAIQYLI